MASDNESSRCMVGSVIGGMVASMAWPCTLLIVFFVLLGPIKGLLGSFTEMTRNSDSQRVSFGTFSLEVNRLSAQTGDPTVRESLGGLTFDELFHFLVTGGEYGDETVYKPPVSVSRSQRIYEHLVKRGLIELVPDEQIQAGTELPKAPHTIFKTTEKGRRIHGILMTTLQAQWTLSSPPSSQQ